MAVFGNPWLAKEKRRVDRGLVLLQVVAALALLIAPAYALTFSLAHPPQRHDSVSNCKDIQTALEMYCSDAGGRYPPGPVAGDFKIRVTIAAGPHRDDPFLHSLNQSPAGNYLKRIPTCSGPEFHSRRYKFPQYVPETGLEEHP